GIVCASLVLAVPVRGEPPTAGPPLIRGDRYGDPLPEGAIARLGTLRLRHSGEVNSVAFSPDGKLVASAATGNVSRWDRRTGQEVNRFKGKIQGDVVTFSPDGRTLFCANRGPIQHWDVASGRLIHELKGSESFHGLVAAFSPDRRILALTDHGNNALLV